MTGLELGIGLSWIGIVSALIVESHRLFQVGVISERRGLLTMIVVFLNILYRQIVDMKVEIFWVKAY